MAVATDTLSAFRLAQLDNPSTHDESLAALRDLLGDPYADPLEEELEARYRDVTLESDIRGLLQFYLLSRAAEQWANGDVDDPLKRQCDRLLQSPDLLHTLETYYRLPARYVLGALSLFKIGTTSFILASRTPRERAEPNLLLKIIKPRHIRNPTICRALEETWMLYNTEDFRGFIPEYDEESPVMLPGDSVITRRFLGMQYINGLTLREALKNAASKAPHPRAAECLRLARVVTSEVCAHLSSLRAHKLDHLDLSPDNLILSEGRRPDSICLLDFGINHVLRGAGTTSSADVIRAARYVAPELLRAEDLTRVPVETADPFSLGMLLAELLAGCDPGLQTCDRDAFLKAIGGSPEDLLDRIRGIHFGLGATLEALLDANPDTRVFEYRDDSEVYKNLSKDILAAMSEFEVAADKGWMSPLRQSISGVEPETVGREHILAAITRVITAFGEPAHRRSALLKSCRTLCGTACIFLMWLAFESAREHWAVDLGIAWPGWIVAVTFTFVATKYYLSIYSGITAEGLDTRTEWLMRLNAISFVPPIAYTLTVDPTAWAACCAWGVAVVSVNNHYALKLARRAEDSIKDAGLETPRPSKQSGFIEHFDGWAPLTLAYVGLLAFLHIGMRRGLLADVGFYALVVVALNLKMFRYNCWLEAPAIRLGLMWLYENCRRARTYLETKPRAPKPARPVLPEFL